MFIASHLEFITIYIPVYALTMKRRGHIYKPDRNFLFETILKFTNDIGKGSYFRKHQYIIERMGDLHGC